jgi:hypothetical protein
MTSVWQYMSGDWWGTLWTLLVTFCIVIIRCTETLWSPCISNILKLHLRFLRYTKDDKVRIHILKDEILLRKSYNTILPVELSTQRRSLTTYGIVWMEYRWPWARQLPRHVAADVGILYCTAAVLRDKIEEMLSRCRLHLHEALCAPGVDRILRNN